MSENRLTDFLESLDREMEQERARGNPFPTLEEIRNGSVDDFMSTLHRMERDLRQRATELGLRPTRYTAVMPRFAVPRSFQEAPRPDDEPNRFDELRKQKRAEPDDSADWME